MTAPDYPRLTVDGVEYVSVAVAGQMLTVPEETVSEWVEAGWMRTRPHPYSGTLLVEVDEVRWRLALDEDGTVNSKTNERQS